MCLIIVKKKGTIITNELYKSISRSYSLRNRDGFGFSIKKPNKDIYISKGYMDLKSFINAIKSHKPHKRDEIMIHLRKVSAGARNIENCHPYVCSNIHDEIVTEEGYVKKGVMSHNGTIHKYGRDKIFSDTYLFVKDNLDDANMLTILSYLNKKDKTSMIAPLISGSRIAIMHPKSNTGLNIPITMLGDWIHDDLSGLYFSNTSFLGDNCPKHGDNFPKSGYVNMFEREKAYDKHMENRSHQGRFDYATD